MLQCPSCGWENIKSEKLDAPSKKICEQTKSLDTAVPCSKFTDFADKPYEGYNVCQTGNDAYPNFSCNSSSSPANILPDATIHSYRPQLRDTYNYTSPPTKQAKISIEHCNVGIQNVTPPSQTPNHAATDTIQKCNKKVQTKSLEESNRLRQVAVNTEKCHKGTQNTIRVAHGNCNCQTFEKCSSTIQKSKQVDKKTETCPEDMQNVIGVKFRTVECCTPNFLFISSDGNCAPLKERDFKLRRLAIDKCQNTDLCQDQKGSINILKSFALRIIFNFI